MRLWNYYNIKRLTIQTGTELKVLNEQYVKAGAVIEYSQATDKAEGPVTVDPAEGRVFILSKKGEHYLQTIKPGASTTEVASALGTAQREIQLVIKDTCDTVSRAATQAEK